MTMDKLANCFQKQGNFTESENIYRMVVDLYQKRFGKEHPETISAFNSLIEVRLRKGECDLDLEIMCKNHLALSIKVMRNDHRTSLYAMKHLAWVLEERKQYAEAEILYRKLKETQEKVLGKENPDTLSAMYDLAQFLTLRGTPEGDILHLETLKLREKVSGPSHHNTFCVSAVAKIREREGKDMEASALYQTALEGYRKTFGEQHSSTQRALRNYEGLLESRRRANDGGVLQDNGAYINSSAELFYESC